ncbi:hypothetical protein C0966_12700 [Bacillus methanolicus]|nr:hypothetical protein [Bacillus methanolicus]
MKKIFLLAEEDVLRANSKLTLKEAYRIILASMKVFTKNQQLFSSVLVKKKIVSLSNKITYIFQRKKVVLNIAGSKIHIITNYGSFSNYSSFA